MSFEDSLAESLKTLATAAAKPDITVTDGELKAMAEQMAKTGYDFTRTPNSLKALRAYGEGKPLCLAGTTGSGKTMWFKSLQESGVAKARIVIYSLTEHGNDFVRVVADDIKRYRDCELVVDDVGTESNWNGHRADDVLTRIIAVREQTDKRTHYTTNLSAAQLKSRYDERVVSRLRLCVFVPMAGADNRSASTNPAEAEFLAKCTDPKNWELCAERCSRFVNNRCAEGKTVPPILRNSSPEASCRVGDAIPYSAEWIEADKRLREARRRNFIKLGLSVPDYLNADETGR